MERKGWQKFDSGKFLEIWNSSICVKEVAERTGYNKNSCKTLASKLRAGGAALKRFRRKSSVVALGVSNAN